MSDDQPQVHAAQAEHLETLASFVRAHDLPVIGWYVDGAGGAAEGVVYRESMEAIRADLTVVAEALGVEVHEEEGGQEFRYTRLWVEGRHDKLAITVRGGHDDNRVTG